MQNKVFFSCFNKKRTYFHYYSINLFFYFEIFELFCLILLLFLEFISNNNTLKELENKWFEIAPNMLMYNYSVTSEDKKNEISAAIKQFYFGNKPVSQETVKELVQVKKKKKSYTCNRFVNMKFNNTYFILIEQMYGDRAFYNDIIRAIRVHASVATKDVYCYKFSYRGKYSISNLYAKNFNDYGQFIFIKLVMFKTDDLKTFIIWSFKLGKRLPRSYGIIFLITFRELKETTGTI